MTASLPSVRHCSWWTPLPQSPSEAQAGGAGTGRVWADKVQGFLMSVSESGAKRLGLLPRIHV